MDSSLITVILLGLLALGHATPLILDEHHLTSMTTAAPHVETTAMKSTNHTLAEDKVKAELEEVSAAEGIDEEASGEGENQDSSAGRVQRHSDSSLGSTVEPTQISTTTSPQDLPVIEPMDAEASGEEEDQDSRALRLQRHSDSSTGSTVEPAQSSTVTSSPQPTTALLLTSEEGSGDVEGETTTPSTTTTQFFIIDEGSGDEETTTTTTTETTTAALTTEPSLGSGDDDDDEEIQTMTTTTTTETPTTTEESTVVILSPGDDEETTTTTMTTTTAEVIPVVLPDEKDEGEDVGETDKEVTTAITTTAVPIIVEIVKQGRGFGLESVQGVTEVAEVTEEAVSSMTIKDPQSLVENPTEMPKGHVTPDWIIIVGFLVGVALLVLICVAVATRDRWNRPNQFNNTGIIVQPADQQRATELETFLHSEQPPKENGKAEEYTVIPLDELPHSYSS